MTVEILTRNWYFKTVGTTSFEFLVNSRPISGLYIMFILKCKMHQITDYFKSVGETALHFQVSIVKQLEK